MEKLAFDLYFYIDKNQDVLTPNWKIYASKKENFRFTAFWVKRP